MVLNLRKWDKNFSLILHHFLVTYKFTFILKDSLSSMERQLWETNAFLGNILTDIKVRIAKVVMLGIFVYNFGKI